MATISHFGIGKMPHKGYKFSVAHCKWLSKLHLKRYRAMKKKKVVYPLYARDEKLSVKVKSKDIPVMKQMFKAGYSLRAIGRKFKVAHHTVSYNIDPEQRKIKKEKARCRKVKYSPAQREAESRFRKRKTKMKRDFQKWVNQLGRQSHNRLQKIRYKKLLEDEQRKGR